MHILYVDRPYTLDFYFFPIPSPLYVYILIFFFWFLSTNSNVSEIYKYSMFYMIVMSYIFISNDP